MGEGTKIQWTNHTFNPWWGCQRVSPGCVHCYAETFDRRVSGVDGSHWGAAAERRFFGDKHWNEPVKWNRDAIAAGERRRVFCSSMADVFEARPELIAPRARLAKLIESTPGLDWMLLTKRPENIGAMQFPVLQNVWMGTTVEDAERKARIDILRQTIAAVRFLSIEPLLEDLGTLDLRGIDLVIVGGESGIGARPFFIEWARSIRAQCESSGSAFFMKQVGAFPMVRSWDAEEWPAHVSVHAHRVYLADKKKGGAPEEWPEDLRVRQLPGGSR